MPAVEEPPAPTSADSSETPAPPTIYNSTEPRQRKKNLQLNPRKETGSSTSPKLQILVPPTPITAKHTRVSSVNLAKTPIDRRPWWKKRRNISYIVGIFSLFFILAFVILYSFSTSRESANWPYDGRPRDGKLAESEKLAGHERLHGKWSLSKIGLQTPDNYHYNNNNNKNTAADPCAQKMRDFYPCSANRLLSAGKRYEFRLVEDSDGNFMGKFSPGIFDLEEMTSIALSSSKMGLRSTYWYDGNSRGPLTEEGCGYGRSVQILIRIVDDQQIYVITEQQLVETKGDCKLSNEQKSDRCVCNFVGVR